MPTTNTKHSPKISTPKFFQLARAWTSAGYVVIPGRGPKDKRPAVRGWGAGTALVEFTDRHGTSHSLTVPRGAGWANPRGGVRDASWRDRLEEWDEEHPDACGLLLPASGPSPLVVIDVDDPQWESWVLEMLGDTPCRVSTGREGGGVHLYYRMHPNHLDDPCYRSRVGKIGPKEAWIAVPGKNDTIVYKTKIDIKGGRGYVVAPGSLHRTGRTYEATLEADEMLRQAPVANPKVLERLLEEGLAYQSEKMAAAGLTVQTKSFKKTQGLSCARSEGSTATILGKLDEDLRIQGAGSTAFTLRELRVGDQAPCHCPMHDDRSPSAFAARGPSGRAFVFCSSCGGKFVSRELGFEPPVPRVSCAPFPLSNNHTPSEKVRSRTLELDPEVRVSEQLADLEDLLPEGGLLLLRARHASGKTHLARRWSEGRTLVVVTPLRALTAEAARRYDATPYTEDGVEDHPRVAVTTHSAGRIRVEPRGETVRTLTFATDGRSRRDLVVLDEFDQTVQSWHSQPCRGRGAAVMHATLEHATRSKWTVAMSADLDEAHMDWLEEVYLAANPDAQVLRAVQPSKRAGLTVRLVRPSVLDKERDTALESGGKVLTLHTSREAPEREALRWTARGLRTWWASGDNSRIDQVQDGLRDLDAIVRDHDLVALSPVAATGVDVQEPVGGVFLDARGGPGAHALVQMLRRARNAPEELVVHVHARGEKELEVRPERVRRWALQQARMTATFARQTGLVTDYRGRPHDEAFLASWLLTEIRRRVHRRDPVQAFVRVCQAHGIRVIDDREREADDVGRDVRRAEKKEAKSVVDRKRADEVARAVQLPPERAEQLGRQHRMTSGEKRALERMEIETFYEVEANPELVRRDKRGKLREQIRRGCALLLRQTSGKAHAASRDLAELLDGEWLPDPTELQHHELRMRVTELVFDKILDGRTLHEADGMVLDGTSLAARVGPMLQSAKMRALISEVTRSSPSEATVENPIRWCLERLRAHGLTVERRGFRKQRTYLVTLNDADWRPELRRQVRAYHETRQRRMYGRVIGPAPAHASTDVDEILRTLIEEE